MSNATAAMAGSTSRSWLGRLSYRDEVPRELSVIEGEIKALEADIERLLREVTA